MSGSEMDQRHNGIARRQSSHRQSRRMVAAFLRDCLCDEGDANAGGPHAGKAAIRQTNAYVLLTIVAPFHRVYTTVESR